MLSVYELQQFLNLTRKHEVRQADGILKILSLSARRSQRKSSEERRDDDAQLTSARS